MQENRVLYLSYDGLTDPLGQSQIVPYLIGLSDKGFAISVISFEKKKEGKSIGPLKNDLETRNIKWYPLTYTKNPPILSTIYDIVRLWHLTFRLNAIEKFSIVHCRSYITSLVGLWSKRKSKTKFLFDMRGFWVDERVEGGLWNTSNLVHKIMYSKWKSLEKSYFREADHIISLTIKGKEVISEKFEVNDRTKIDVIPCCVDNKLFQPKKMDYAASKKKLNINEDQFVLGYLGSIGTWYMLPEMVSFFKILLQMIPNSIFLFITRELKSTISKEFIKQDLPLKYLRHASISRQQVPEYLQILDWSIFFIKPSFSKQASSPTKQGEIMSMGIPIVCNRNIGDTDVIVKKYSSGIVIDDFNTESYILAIEKMINMEWDPQLLHERSVEYFSLEKGQEKYASIYKKLINLGRSGI